MRARSNRTRNPTTGPVGKDAVDVGADAVAGDVARDAGHQQGVVVGVLVADRGHHGQGDRLFIKSAASRRTADPAAAPQSGMAGDRLGTFGRAAGKQPRDFGRHAGLELHVLVSAALTVSFTAAAPRVLVGEALLFGLLERRLLDQDALPLVPLAAATPPHHHGRKHASLFRPAGQRGVARAEEDQVIQVGAGHAQRSHVVHRQQVAGTRAPGAHPVLDRHDDNQVGRLGRGHNAGLMTW